MEGGTTQIRIRLALLILAVFLVISQRFGLESILGAFVGGVVLADLRHHERGLEAGFWPKVDAIGFGFLIPVYFVTSGVRFNLDGLIHTREHSPGCRCSSAFSSWAVACLRCSSAVSSGPGRRPRSPCSRPPRCRS